MRKLAWAALGFAAAAGLAEYILPVKGLPYLAAALAVLSPLSLLLKGRKRRMRAWIFVLSAALGLTGWFIRYERHIAPGEAMTGQTVTVTARVADYVERHDHYERVEVRITDGAPREKTLLYFYEGILPELVPGDIIQADVRFTSVVTRQGERSHTYTSQGVNMLGYIQPDTLSVTGTAGSVWRAFPQRLCRAIETLCDRLFPADVSPLVKGLLTGNTAELEENVQVYSAMRQSGVLHIVAVSGMHMFVLIGFIQLVLGKSRRTSLICLPFIALFTLVAGLRPSIVRAAVMQSMYLLSPIFRREADETTCLGAALLLLLAVNPMAVGSVGLQLSFLCMAGFVFIMPRMMGWMSAHLPMRKKAVRFICSNFACTVSATAFSAPLSAFYFGEMPLLSPLSNVLTLLIVEISFAASYVTCAVGAVFPPLGRCLGWLLAWPLRWCMLVYRTIAALPFASLYMGSPRAVAWLVFLYFLFVVWFILRRKRRRFRLDIPIALGVITLSLLLIGSKLSIRPGQGRLTVLDVGQGQCVVLADSDSTVVVDCGGSGMDNAGDIAAGYLFSIGKTRVDMLVLSHLHADHANGVETLLYRMNVDRILLPAEADDESGVLPAILEAAARRGTQVLWISEPSHAQVGDIGLDLLLPLTDGDVNERGIVVTAELLGSGALIMGDAGEEAETALLTERAVPDVDILVAGHHGSRTASTNLFLRAAQAETAIVSVGYNTYGHPTEEALARLGAYCGTVLRTDLEGNITIKLRSEE